MLCCEKIHKRMLTALVVYGNLSLIIEGFYFGIALFRHYPKRCLVGQHRLPTVC